MLGHLAGDAMRSKDGTNDMLEHSYTHTQREREREREKEREREQTKYSRLQ